MARSLSRRIFCLKRSVLFLKIALCYLLHKEFIARPTRSRPPVRTQKPKLTNQQFQELSINVYDELVRLKNSSENEGEHTSTGISVLD